MNHLKHLLAILSILMLLIPGVVLALEMSETDHDMNGMMMLESEVADGVKAMFHLSDVKAEMAKAGKPFTHRLMAIFIDLKTGKAIESGKVAVKVKTPADVEGKPQRLISMDGYFSVDLILDQTGTYQFKIGSKLADGQKREFNPQHNL